MKRFFDQVHAQVSGRCSSVNCHWSGLTGCGIEIAVRNGKFDSYRLQGSSGYKATQVGYFQLSLGALIEVNKRNAFAEICHRILQNASRDNVTLWLEELGWAKNFRLCFSRAHQYSSLTAAKEKD